MEKVSTEQKIECENCGQLFLINELNENGHCENCQDEFSSCDECGNLVHRDDIHYHDNYVYCESCFDCNFTWCDCCEEITHNDNIISTPNQVICERCYEDNYFCCDCCGEVFQNDDYAEDGHCIACSDQNKVIHNYEYKPEPNFYGDGPLFFGIELEVENTENREYNEDVADCLPGFLYAKADGSLDDGFEIVSHPLSWNWLRENSEKWQYVFSLKEKGFRSYNTTTCGIHVHLTKSVFSGLHLYKFLKLFYENPGFIGVISRRRIEKLKEWASLESDTSIIYKARTKNNGNSERHVAVNLENYHTVEVRIFRGTLGRGGFWLNLEFCKAAYDFTKLKGIKEITVADFCNYVADSKKEFPNLFSFLEKRNYVHNSL